MVPKDLLLPQVLYLALSRTPHVDFWYCDSGKLGHLQSDCALGTAQGISINRGYARVAHP
jgi:hypothetical protein